MTYIIIGGSSGLGRALAERFAKAGHDLILTSRDVRDTTSVANHLSIKYAVKVSAITLDLASSPLLLHSVDEALNRHSALQGLLIPAGINDDHDMVGLSDDKLEYISRVNYVAPVQLLNHYLPLLEQSSGMIVGFGSIATARGRSRNAAYAAAKRALQSYFESLTHHTADSNIACQYYILGYLDTNLAFAQKLLFPLASPEKIADMVYRRQRQNSVRFSPRLWFIIYRTVQLLPWPIFKRLSF